MDHGERAHERIGELIAGRYRLERLLGAGGMGAVYEAVHEFTQRRVAVKLMHPAFARSRQAAERFVREAQAPSSIGHAGIVEVLDGGRAEDGSLYLVLELLQGQTLGAAMRGAALPPSQLIPIAIDLLEALGAAHAAGFVHRDIKPDNVFLVAPDEGHERPQVKLLDFGVISVLSEDGNPGLTQAGSVLGTPLYMSPEQALGRRIDGRSDLWSVGAVCYQALTGRVPFVGESAQALIISISTEEHLPISVVRPGLPLRLVKVVERALNKQVDKRWQSAGEMAAALRTIAADEERGSDASTAVGDLAVPAAAVRSQVEGNAKPAPSLRAPLAIGLALCALVAGAGAWALSRPTHRTTLAAGTGALAAAGEPAPAEPPAAEAVEPPAAEASAPPVATVPPAAEPAAPPVRAAEPGEPPRPADNTGSPLPPAAKAAAVALEAPAAGLAADVISSALRAHDGELQRCYEDSVIAELTAAQAPSQQDPAALRLDAELTIDPAGTVSKLELRGDIPEAMRGCARAAIQSWKFPVAKAPTDIRFPMVFQPNIVRR